jgi:hypothetical protein
MTHGLHFLKLYLLHCYETGVPFSKLNKAFVNTILKVSCADPKSGKKAKDETIAVKSVLRDVYDRNYKPHVSEAVPYTHLELLLQDAPEVLPHRTLSSQGIQARLHV